MTNPGFDSLTLPAAQLENLKQLGFREMTDIQAAALPLTLKGEDLIAKAKTGSGKTAAFALALLERLDVRDFDVQALVLCPTRELADQVASEIRRLARYQQNIKVLTLCGGQPIGPQIGSLAHGAHVVVGTPGRISDHLRKQTLSLARVSTLVLDEADRMLEMGFAEDIEGIASKTPDTRQTLLFSATYPQDIMALSAKYQRGARQVTVESLHSEALIKQHFFLCREEHRMASLAQLLAHYRVESAAIFCNTRQRVSEVADDLNERGIQSAALHGDMDQSERDQVLIQFRHRSCRVLVATDVAARGLDIDDLSAVFNFELPRNTEVYVHRIGRTGRAGKEGLAVSLLTDAQLHKLSSIGAYLGRELAFEPIETLTQGHDELPPAPFVTLVIAGGRKHKLRPGDILGALTGDAGIDGGSVGKITIGEYAAYVAVKRSASERALAGLLASRIKGRKFKVRKL